MPTFYAAALDRTLEPEASTSTEPFHLNSPISNVDKTQPKEQTFIRPTMLPSLYATPKEIPLPYTHDAFPLSPYIVNHKGRGVLIHSKSSSEVNVPPPLHGNADMSTSLRKSTSLSFPRSEDIAEEHIRERPVWDRSPTREDFWNEDSGRDNSNGANGLERESNLLKPVRIKSDKEREWEDFYKPGVSLSFTRSTKREDDAGAGSVFSSSTGEYYDAREELSTDSGGSYKSVSGIEVELREIRLSLLLEIEKRRQAEETLEKMQVHWRMIREQLAEAGLFVPLDPTSSQYSLNIADELRCQLEVTSFVSDSLANDLAKAEVEMEMESKLEAKNFEITRLSDRLHYYETVNQEMTQRNQEAIEVARREQEKRKKRQRWIWGSIATTITLGGAVLAWSYFPTVTSSADVTQSQSPSEPKLQQNL